MLKVNHSLIHCAFWTRKVIGTFKKRDPVFFFTSHQTDSAVRTTDYSVREVASTTPAGRALGIS